MGCHQMRSYHFNRIGLVPDQNHTNDHKMLISGRDIANPRLGTIPKKMTVENQRYCVLKFDK